MEKVERKVEKQKKEEKEEEEDDVRRFSPRKLKL